jgi:putative hydrolase of the HAD superfamily
MPSITALFLDVDGVLGTIGWDRQARERAAKHFNLDRAEVDERHHLTFDTYEEGKLSMDEYLAWTISHEPRNFSRDDFKALMFAHSEPYPQLI